MGCVMVEQPVLRTPSTTSPRELAFLSQLASRFSKLLSIVICLHFLFRVTYLNVCPNEG